MCEEIGNTIVRSSQAISLSAAVCGDEMRRFNTPPFGQDRAGDALPRAMQGSVTRRVFTMPE